MTTKQRQAKLDKINERIANLQTSVEEFQTTVENALQEVLATVIQGKSGDSLKAEIDDLISETTDLYDDLEETRSNLEEKFSETERYQRLDELVGSVEALKETVEGMELYTEVDFSDLLAELTGNLIDELREAESKASEIEVSYSN